MLAFVKKLDEKNCFIKVRPRSRNVQIGSEKLQ